MRPNNRFSWAAARWFAVVAAALAVQACGSLPRSPDAPALVAPVAAAANSAATAVVDRERAAAAAAVDGVRTRVAELDGRIRETATVAAATARRVEGHAGAWLEIVDGIPVEAQLGFAGVVAAVSCNLWRNRKRKKRGEPT